MRLKYYLRGLGLGIIFAVIILSVNTKSKTKEMSDSQIMERASELGMVISTEIETEEVSPDSDDAILENTEASDDTEVLKDTETGDGTDTTDEADVTGDTASADNAENSMPEQNDPAAPVTIVVESGENCRSIAQKLQSASLIADAEDFRVYMGKRGIASLIKTGTHQVPPGATYEEIADILTN